MCLVQNRWRRDLLEAFPSSSEKWWYRDSRVETAILWNYWSLVISKTSLCLRHLIKLLRFEPTQHWSISLQFYVVPTTLSKNVCAWKFSCHVEIYGFNEHAMQLTNCILCMKPCTKAHRLLKEKKMEESWTTKVQKQSIHLQQRQNSRALEKKMEQKYLLRILAIAIERVGFRNTRLNFTIRTHDELPVS